MSKIVAALSKTAEFFGFKRNTKYVDAYIHRANIRSGVFMAAVVAILEVWLVIRQHIKYIIPAVEEGTPYFKSLFDNTSLFWLQMVMGLSMFFYCLYYLSNKKNKGLFISILVSSGIGFSLCFLLPREGMIKEWCYGNPDKYLIHTILLIILYAAIALYHVIAVSATITKYLGKKIDWLQSVAVITIFATCLLIFGIRVSYGDFASIKGGVANPDYKQIICFLMMSIYVGCLLIWRPYISVAILGAIFIGFYLLLKGFYNRTGIRDFPDGDQVNYITFFISLLMISISIFSQRQVEAKKDEAYKKAIAACDEYLKLCGVEVEFGDHGYTMKYHSDGSLADAIFEDILNTMLK